MELADTGLPRLEAGLGCGPDGEGILRLCVEPAGWGDRAPGRGESSVRDAAESISFLREPTDV